MRVQSPHHACSQDFTLVPSPTSCCRSFEKFNQSLLMNFLRLTPYALDSFRATLLHRASVSMPYLPYHLPNKAELKLLKRLIPSLPTCTGLQTLAHFFPPKGLSLLLILKCTKFSTIHVKRSAQRSPLT